MISSFVLNIGMFQLCYTQSETHDTSVDAYQVTINVHHQVTQYTSLDYVQISDLLLSVHYQSEKSSKPVEITYGNISMELPYESSYLYG